MVDLDLTIIGIIALWISGIIVGNNYTESRWKRRKNNLSGRIVRLSKTFRTSHNVGEFGKIRDVNQSDDKHKKLLALNVYCMLSKNQLKLEKEAYDKEYKKQIEQYRVQLKAYNKRLEEMGGVVQYQISQYQETMSSSSYSPYAQNYHNPEYDPPIKPEYSFTNSTDTNRYYTINKKDLKIMPKNFDIITGTIIKPMQPKKKGGERNKGHMPRIFKYLLLLALVIFVFSLVGVIDRNLQTIFNAMFSRH